MVQSGITVGLDFLQVDRIIPVPSHIILGAEPQEASQSTAVDVMPLFLQYRSDSCLLQSSFPVVVREDPGIQAAGFVLEFLPSGFLVM